MNHRAERSHREKPPANQEHLIGMIYEQEVEFILLTREYSVTFLFY